MTPAHRLNTVLQLIALAAIAIPALIIARAPHIVVRHPHRTMRRVVPPAELPTVEPVEFEALDPDDARTFNASVPFSTDPNPAARPFRLPGDDIARTRATDCMAAAVLYEAGNDADGQRAVAQVVINRVRHPAFPKTICGVVFEGSERATGCQFTFTCDGALANHKWSDDSWATARKVASAALNGAVFAPVGYSTHYHTDWVVPYWQSSLDKVAAVHTHLFFRWTGWWGTPGAFHRRVAEEEPVIAALAGFSDAHRPSNGVPEMPSAAVATAAPAATPIYVKPVPGDPDGFLLALDGRFSPDDYPALAAEQCGTRVYCKIFAWKDAALVPSMLPLRPEQMATMVFSYLRDTAHGFDKPLWNCTIEARRAKGQCMKQQFLPDPAAVENGPALPATALPSRPSGAASLQAPPADLTGIHRRGGNTGGAPVAAPNGAAPHR